jgi:DNA-binding NarL/FixJ family response regulator
VSTERVRVLIADDHAVVREGVRSVLADADDLEVVAEAADGAEALDLLERHDPDVAVVDVSMPGRTGLEIASELQRRGSTTRVLILSMYHQAEYVLEAVRACAHGYLLKDAAPGELRDAVRAVHRGETPYSPLVAQQLGAAVRGELEREERRGMLELLTAREREVLGRVAAGRSNKEIAAEFGISPRTVESHRKSLTRKLSIRSIAGLTRFAIEAGLAPEDPPTSTP